MADVLIIDDDTRLATALAALLRQDGHEATFAPSAGEGLASLRQHEPDLVLLDLTMPTTDGLDLLDALREEPRFEDLRIAVFSGRDDAQTVKSAEELGACAFIPKGGPWESIRGRINDILAGEPRPA